MQYCYDMHCHTWIRKTIRRENSFIIRCYNTQCMNHTEYSEAVKLNVDSDPSIYIFQNIYSIKIIYYYNCSSAHDKFPALGAGSRSVSAVSCVGT